VNEGSGSVRHPQQGTIAEGGGGSAEAQQRVAQTEAENQASDVGPPSSESAKTSVKYQVETLQQVSIPYGRDNEIALKRCAIIQTSGTGPMPDDRRRH
jgi:hypothetical protein